MYRQFLLATLTIASITLSPASAIAQVAVGSTEAAIESSTAIVNLPRLGADDARFHAL